MFDALAELEVAVDKVAADESRLDVERICRIAERVEFLKLRTIAQYDRSGEWQADGHVSTASALRAKCRSTPGSVHRSVVLARKLEHLPETSAAFGAGEISRQHAEMIAGPCTPARAVMIQGIERELVDYARLSDPKRLRGAVKRMTDAFDGDGGAASDLAEYRKNQMTLSPTLDGRGALNGSLDAESTEIAISALEAMMATLERKGDRRKWPERRAEAFVEICRRSADHAVPSTRRERPHLSAVYDVQALEADHPALLADLRDETEHVGRLSRTTLERLLCDCQLSRVLTDGPSIIIDVGRTTRTIPPKLWKALVVRDRHCQEPGCDRPPGACEAHHIWHWSRGGPTNLDNLKLGCWQHHREWHLRDALQRE